MPGRRVSLIWQSDPTLNAPPKYRRACAYDAFIPGPLSELTASLDAEVAGVVSEAERAIHALNTEAQPALAPLARLLLRTESVASSKVEGMQVGVRELARAEARAETRQKASATALEVLANIDAMQLAVDDAATVAEFTVAQIGAIHGRLTAGAPNARMAGKIRTAQNWIGGNDHNPCGADFVPPPPEHVLPLLGDLCTAIDAEVWPPVVQAAIVHAQFETIHPFDDGNGRTGRALVQVVLRRRGLASAYVPPISVVLAGSRDRYIAGLTGFREDRVAAWVEQFADAAARAAHLAQACVRAVQGLTLRWRALLSAGAAPRADAAAWAIIDALPAYPLITAPVAAGATGRAKAAVYQALEQLQAAGVLTPTSARRRDQAWEAVGLTELLARFEAGSSI